MVYFGDPLPEVRELQRQFGGPVAHRVEHPDEHAECQLAGCVDVAQLTRLVTTRFLELGTSQGRRLANHRPTPLDGMRGGAYSDVGSAERPRYRQAAEQRMAYRHLRTAGRDNCYDAKVPRASAMGSDAETALASTPVTSIWNITTGRFRRLAASPLDGCGGRLLAEICPGAFTLTRHGSAPERRK